jgi:hypothetical protein
MDKRIKPVRHLDALDGTVYGRYNKLNMVNPYKTKFIAHYEDGTSIVGNNLFDTGWSDVKDGIKLLQFKLSTGHVINIPKFHSYLPTIEVSESVDGFKLFHAIHVHCIGDDKIIKYKIVLKEDNISKYKIGDVIISHLDKGINSTQWKMSC